MLIMIIVIIITISSSSSSISFVVLLNCLYLNPRVSFFGHFFSPSCWGGRRGVSERLSSAELPAAWLNRDTEASSASDTYKLFVRYKCVQAGAEKIEKIS